MFTDWSGFDFHTFFLLLKYEWITFKIVQWTHNNVLRTSPSSLPIGRKWIQTRTYYINWWQTASKWEHHNEAWLVNENFRLLVENSCPVVVQMEHSYGLDASTQMFDTNLAKNSKRKIYHRHDVVLLVGNSFYYLPSLKRADHVFGIAKLHRWMSYPAFRSIEIYNGMVSEKWPVEIL